MTELPELRALVDAAKEALYQFAPEYPLEHKAKDELRAALAALRVAELERVVEAARGALQVLEYFKKQTNLVGRYADDNSEEIDNLRAALVALDAPAKEGA